MIEGYLKNILIPTHENGSVICEKLIHWKKALVFRPIDDINKVIRENI